MQTRTFPLIILNINEPPVTPFKDGEILKERQSSRIIVIFLEWAT